MAKTKRNQPKNAPSSDATTTLMDFERRFPDDAACLDELVRMLYPDGIHCPKCEKVTKHHRLKARPAYSCQFCGHLEYPMKGTIFEGSSTSLKLWMYAMYLMASTRCGISAKQLEREIGVSYPTALRMFRQIRSLLDQDDVLLSGTVEMDEAYFGGNAKWRHKDAPDPKRGRGTRKAPVFGMVQRAASGEHGKVSAVAVGGVTWGDLLPHVQTKVLPGSMVFTDEWGAYERLGKMGYSHSRVHHSSKVYVSGTVHTQSIEGFWGNTKRGIRGVYHGVSQEYLQDYLDEYVFRYNHRGTPGGMFEAMLGRVTKSTD
ncbi:MAG: IS1595 family transposase [Actinobacteria bacterium]|nr:IS1595 family transposase [Actinomycetota bacterium]